MDKKWVGLFVFGGLAAAFVIVSALVVLSRRNPWFVAKKLRIGGMLLGLTAMTTLTACPATCYMPALVIEEITFDSSVGKTITVDNVTNLQLNGTFSNRTESADCYFLRDEFNRLMGQGDIASLNGPRTTILESFKIPVDSNLSPGTYQLLIYRGSLSNLSGMVEQFSLQLTNSRPDFVDLNGYDQLTDTVYVTGQTNRTVYGAIQRPSVSNFSYRLVSNQNVLLLQGDLTNRVLFSDWFSANVDLPDTLPSGDYQLYYFAKPSNQVADNTGYIRKFNLSLTNG